MVYSDAEYIGKRIGSMTVVSREGKKFRFRCDCGREKLHRPVDVFKRGAIKSCGHPDCKYHQYWLRNGHETRLAGIAFEVECAAVMEEQGYDVKLTKESGDFGVDFFAEADGIKVAFQCKRLKKASMVSAVQEVYAGGRYYDCTKFVVVSPSGFTYPAELMAAKLGVQLELDLHNFRLKSLTENKIETQKMTAFSNGRKLIWEIDGVIKPAQEWCDEYNISRQTVVSRVSRGMDLKTALTASRYGCCSVINIAGVEKTKREWCDEYGVSTQLYDYRIKHGGLSPVEALTRPKANVRKEA